MVDKRKSGKMRDLQDIPTHEIEMERDPHDLDRDDYAQAVARNFMTPYVSRFVADADAPRWDALEHLAPGDAVPLIDPSLDKAFDLLRTRLRHTVRDHGWKNIAVTAPTRGCGNTFTAVRLAQSLARVPSSRTVLMDFNMRNPGVAQAMDLPDRGAMSAYLSGAVPMAHHLCRASDTLALGLNAQVEDAAAEILQDPATLNSLDQMRRALRPDMVLYDMPPLLAHDDVAAFLPHLDGVLLVSDGTRTTARHLKECERILEGQVPLLGVILNRARRSSIPEFH